MTTTTRPTTYVLRTSPGLYLGGALGERGYRPQPNKHLAAAFRDRAEARAFADRAGYHGADVVDFDHEPPRPHPEPAWPARCPTCGGLALVVDFTAVVTVETDASGRPFRYSTGGVSDGPVFSASCAAPGCDYFADAPGGEDVAELPDGLAESLALLAGSVAELRDGTDTAAHPSAGRW